jgi:monodehydroascorbate reductase (NADH)
MGRRTAMATAAAAAAAAAAATRAAAAEAAETLIDRSLALGANVGPWDYVILGGGNAGGYAARELVKQLGEDVKGRALLIGAEPVVPYERPALTKAYLHPPGAKVRARLPGFHTSVGGGGERQTPQWYEDKGIGVRSGTRVASVDAKKKTLTLEGGEEVKYGTLFFCTGASALKAADIGITGQPSSGVHYVREEADAASLVSAFEGLQKASEEKKVANPSWALQEKGKVVLVGGGYIGLEVAAAAAGWGFEPTVVLPDKEVLPKVFPKPYSEKFQKRYEDAGIKFEFGSRVSSLSQAPDGRLSGVVLKDGKMLPADLAVLGVGARPNVELLSGQVKEKDGAILVDDQMKTSDKNIYAFGDVVTFPLGKDLKRLEHVAHARSSAAHAVQAATGKKPGPYNIVPYFYSRVFEYTDKPLAWFQWGEQKGEHAEFEYPGGSLGEVWVDKGKVAGALVFGSPTPPQSDMDLAKGAVSEKKAVKTADDAAALLGPRKEA